MNSLTVQLQYGTTQIDHLLVSRFGVFVIETKHYNGWIFANPKHPTWTQVIYKKISNFKIRFIKTKGTYARFNYFWIFCLPAGSILRLYSLEMQSSKRRYLVAFFD